MGQQINDNYTLLAGLPIDDRIQKPTIAERDAISQTRRFQGLKCFVVQTQTEYMLVGGVLNSNWVGTAGANVTGALETIIDGFYALTAGKSTLLDWEVGDKFRGWIGNRYLVGTILTLPVSLPSDIDNSSKVDLAVDSNDIVSDRPIVTTSDYIDVTQLDGSPAKILGENISLSVIPPVHHFTPVTTSIKGYFQGVDNALGDISATTAGITTRVWFTADQTTITAGTFDLTNGTGKGTALSHIQSVTNDDNQKKYFTTDLIGIPHPIATIYPAGVYAGNLSASTTPNSAQQRFTVELYKCDNGGTPIASGITGAPVGSLGVTVITILDSGLLTLLDGSVTNVPVSGNLASPLSMAVGERVRYHVSAEKVGTAASNITQSVYYGANYNSYLDVTVPLNTSSVQNLSIVPGATTTNALDNLKTGLDTKLNKTYVSNSDLADNNSNITTSTFDSFGFLCQSLTNKIFMFYREATGHVSNDGKIVMRTSTDGGKTFSGTTIIHSEVAGIDCRNVGGGVTPTGRIIIFFLKVNNVVPTFYSQGTMYSDDDGVTWSTYTPQAYPVGSTFYSPYGNMLTIANGRLLLPYYAISPSGGISSMIKFSDDNGVTWGGDVIVGTDPTNGYNETSFAYLDGGVILAVARRTDQILLRQFLSTDNGQTWTNQGDIASSNTQNVAAWLTSYNEENGEKYVALFSSLRGVGAGVNGVVARKSALISSGVSAWLAETRTLLNTSPNADSGYPSVIVQRGGKKMLGMSYSSTSSTVANYKFWNYTPNAVVPAMSGTTNYVQKKTGDASLSNSTIYDNGTDFVGVGAIAPNITAIGKTLTVSTPTTDGISVLELVGNSIVNGTRTGGVYFGNNASPTVFNAGMYATREGGSSSFADLHFDIRGVGGYRSNAFRIFNSGGVGIGSAATDAGNTNLSIAGLAGTGTRQVVASSTGVLSAGTVQPLKYVALLNQSGTSAPTAAVVENTLGGTLVWTRNSTGNYYATLTGAFPDVNKVICFTGGSISGVLPLEIVRTQHLNSNTVQIFTQQATDGAFVDGSLVQTTIEIRVYN